MCSCNDYEACYSQCRKKTMKHALECLARLVRILMGQTAIAERKMACGSRLDVLGVNIKMSRRGYKCKPCADKVHKWVRTMQVALDENRLSPGAASKLAGRLSWGVSHLFR